MVSKTKSARRFRDAVRRRAVVATWKLRLRLNARTLRHCQALFAAYRMDGPLPKAKPLFSSPYTFSCTPRPHMKAPQRRAADQLVRHDRAVLVVPVVRIEEVELEVLRGLMCDVAAVDDDAAAALPAGHLDRVLGAAHLVRDGGPARRLPHPRLQPEPRM